MDTIVVGIDVSKDRLDVSVHPAGTASSYSRDAGGIELLIEELRPVCAQLVAVEATGGFETVVAASLAAAGLPVVVVNPARVRAFAASLGQRAKTDRIDARVIAQFAAATRPPVRSLPDAATQALADLVTRRRQIVQMIVAEAQREKRASARAKKSIQRLLKSLRAELSEIDGEIDESVRGSAIWRDKEDLLASVPGVGSGTARTMLESCPSWARSIAVRSRRWQGLHRLPVSPASGAARASSAVDEAACGPRCSWRRCAVGVGIRH